MPPPWRVTGRANTTPGQPECAVQVGKKSPASWYLAGGIRIGVHRRRLAAKRNESSARFACVQMYLERVMPSKYSFPKAAICLSKGAIRETAPVVE